MQTFRAYLQDAAGAITWAAWIEAAHLEAAQAQGRDLCPAGTPAVDLWTSSAGRGLSPTCQLEPV